MQNRRKFLVSSDQQKLLARSPDEIAQIRVEPVNLITL